MQEEWKQIEEAPRYYVSNMGRVAYIPRTKKHSYKFVKPYMHKTLLTVALFLKNGKHVTRSLAKLVATYFVSNPNHFTHINHANNDATDNRAVNLEWYNPKKVSYQTKKSSSTHYRVRTIKHKKIDALFYKVMYSIVEDYGNIANCPENDERLRFLRTY